MHAAPSEINAPILGRLTHLIKSSFVSPTVTPYSRTPILWLSTSPRWPAASTSPTAPRTSYLHFTLSARGRNDRATAKRCYCAQGRVLLQHCMWLSVMRLLSWICHLFEPLERSSGKYQALDTDPRDGRLSSCNCLQYCTGKQQKKGKMFLRKRKRY